MAPFIHALKSYQNFCWNDPVLGKFSIRALMPQLDVDIITEWVNDPHAQFWNMEGLSQSEVQVFYETIQNDPDKAVFLGLHDDKPAFLAELYDPAQDALSHHYNVEEGDCGMHLLVAPPEVPRNGFTLAVMRSLLHFIFSNSGVHRVVVEPDIRNLKIHRLNSLVGFTHIKPVQLPHKLAYLGLCSRESFLASLQLPWARLRPTYAPAQTAHLSPFYWEKTNRHLLRKIIAEFAHEEIVQPQQLGDQVWQIIASEALCYEFTARRLMVDHWLVDASSIVRKVQVGDGEWRAEGQPDAVEFLIALRDRLYIGVEDFPLYLEQVNSTLYSACYKLSSGERSANELCSASYQDVEAAMSDGHPIFVANNGRIGFTVADYKSYAPETAQSLPMTWLAAKKSRAIFSSVPEWDYNYLIRQELDAETLSQWREHLIMLELNPDDYYFMPVHPWQWQNKITITFAAEVAQRYLVWLGEAPDLYRAQQSIRTFLRNTLCIGDGIKLISQSSSPAL